MGDRLQTGMRHAYGKPNGTAARVAIGQPIISVRSIDSMGHNVVEALRRAKLKFPGRQKVLGSKKWGFTQYERETYAKMRAEGSLEAPATSLLTAHNTASCAFKCCATRRNHE